MTAVTYNSVFFASALLFNGCFGIINSISSLVEIPPNATYVAGDVEHRLAYWREDIGINIMHWHWHIYHPFTGPRFIVDKDRRGELFYYFHQQLMARYNVERVCNGLNFVPSSFNWDAPLPGAYFPMLSSDVAGREWSPRPPNMKLSDINKPALKGGTQFDIEDLKRFAARILDSISRKIVIDANGTEISIDNHQGIDILANIIEASDLSPNGDYYGNFGLHNFVHLAIGFVHDPQDEYLLPSGVMSETNLAMRDPLFYRLHAFLNDIFVKHKDSLRAYDQKILSFPEVQVTNVELFSHRDGIKCGKENNTLHTYMMKSDINMSRGIDFFPRKPVLVRATHQNHDEFDYTIEYINRSPRPLLGTVRIFLIPVIGDDYDAMKLSEQRHLAIEIDRFVQPLKPGRNRIVRQSTMSSMILPFEQTFRDLDTNRPGDDEYDELDKFNACGCGFPQHLLVPKGTAKGYPMLLFAIITDYSQDWTGQYGVETENNCRMCLFCSLRYQKYPYKLPGGFPFDRPIRNGIDTIEAFLTPNMAIKNITIFHSDEVRQGRILSNAEPTILGRQTPNLKDDGKLENDELQYFLA